MKRLLLAGLLVLPFALARAQQNDAYGSLVGMAYSPDKGPLAETIPADDAPAGERRAGPAPSKDAPEEFAPARAEKPEKPKPRQAGREAAAGEDAPSVAVPAAAAPRVWTKFFSSLMPPTGRLPAFEVAFSSSARRSRAEAPRVDTAASAAGSAQGLLELVAAATTPTAP